MPAFPTFTRVAFFSVLMGVPLAIAAEAVAERRLDGGVSMSNPQWLPEAERNREIDAVGDLGPRIRLPINWSELQPAADTPVEGWKWEVPDSIIKRARAGPGRKLEVLVILGSVPGWANGNGGWAKPALDPETYRRYCREVAKRYLPLGVGGYQIGNEVNLAHPKDGWPSPDGGAYAKGFLSPGVSGIAEAASGLGTRCEIVMGSLAPNTWNKASPAPESFLGQIYRAIPESGRIWTALAYHPYVGPAANPPSAEPNLATTPKVIHAVMAENGEGGKKIWATEFGTPTHGGEYVTDEKVVLTWVEDVTDTWSGYAFAGPLFWYTARDKAPYGHGDPKVAGERENYFGLLRHDFSPKPAYGALKAKFRPAVGLK